MSNLICINKIESVNCFDLSPKFATKLENHSNWEFIYVNSGTVTCTSYNTTCTLKQGDIIFRSPNEPHTTVCNGKSASIFTMMFECRSHAMKAFCKKAMRVPKHLTPLLNMMINECHAVYEISKYPLKTKSDAPNGGEQIIKNLVESFLILLMRDETASAHPLGAPDTAPKSNELAASICAYLSDNLCRQVTLDELSSHFHFGKTHMCVTFKKSMGVSIVEYHTNLKISEAKRLLREESTSIREISERLGFESPEYFTRRFLKYTGYSPRSFRNMLITSIKVKLK